VIDEEVQRLLQEAEEHATALLKSHLDQLERVVELLVERETIDGAEVLAAVGAADRAQPVVVEDVSPRP
jgi:cell division protease FtsH